MPPGDDRDALRLAGVVRQLSCSHTVVKVQAVTPKTAAYYWLDAYHGSADCPPAACRKSGPLDGTAIEVLFASCLFGIGTLMVWVMYALIGEPILVAFLIYRTF